jgi:UDP-glucose 4-epimerase
MLLKSLAKAHPNWKIISLRYSNPAGNHSSGLIGDESATKYAGNLFAVIQQVIVGKR